MAIKKADFVTSVFTIHPQTQDMAEKYKNKYRIPSTRATWWNYGWAGAYFITICTKNREHHFGEIVNGEMVLSKCGVLADVFWHEIKSRNQNVEFGAFVVMPNHIHAILILVKDIAADITVDIAADIAADITVETLHATSVKDGVDIMADIAADIPANIAADIGPDIAVDIPAAETLHATSVQDDGELMSRISPKAGSVARIIGSYKSAVTKHANRLGLENGWQERFHDHIIRNDAEFQRINDYIENNPRNWKEDKFSK